MSGEKIDDKGEITPSSDRRLTRRGGTLSRSFDTIFDDFRRSMDSLMAPFTTLSGERLPTRYPLFDIVDQGENYLIIAEHPGFSKDDVDVEVNQDRMILQTEKKKEQVESEGDYLHRERTYSQVRRSISFPEKVDPSKVKGSMRDGVLEVTVTKKEPKPEEKMHKVELE